MGAEEKLLLEPWNCLAIPRTPARRGPEALVFLGQNEVLALLPTSDDPWIWPAQEAPPHSGHQYTV